MQVKVVYRIGFGTNDKRMVSYGVNKTDEEVDWLCQQLMDFDEYGIYYWLEEEWDGLPGTQGVR